tara:strand:- start:2176 stop:2370 length:195 start_codon:yes stop_codon:yes gene_type:complete
MIGIKGWAVWNNEAWCVEYENLYRTKEEAMKAAKKHYSYIGDTEEDYGDHMVCEIKITVHFSLF